MDGSAELPKSDVDAENAGDSRRPLKIQGDLYFGALPCCWIGNVDARNPGDGRDPLKILGVLTLPYFGAWLCRWISAMSTQKSWAWQGFF